MAAAIDQIFVLHRGVEETGDFVAMVINEIKESDDTSNKATDKRIQELREAVAAKKEELAVRKAQLANVTDALNKKNSNIEELTSRINRLAKKLESIPDSPLDILVDLSATVASAHAAHQMTKPKEL